MVKCRRAGRETLTFRWEELKGRERERDRDAVNFRIVNRNSFFRCNWMRDFFFSVQVTIFYLFLISCSLLMFRQVFLCFKELRGERIWSIKLFIPLIPFLESFYQRRKRVQALHLNPSPPSSASHHHLVSNRKIAETSSSDSQREETFKSVMRE